MPAFAGVLQQFRIDSTICTVHVLNLVVSGDFPFSTFRGTNEFPVSR